MRPVSDNAWEDRIRISGQERIQSICLAGTITTIPLLFGAVQPQVWSIYTGLMICLFLAEWWQNRIDFGFIRNPLLLMCMGGFFVYTLIQIVPLPENFLACLSPFRHRVLQQAAVLLGHKMGRQPLSYEWHDSFSWWIFLVGLFLFAWVFQAYAVRSRNLAAVTGVMLGIALFEALYGLVQALIPTLGVLWASTTAYLGNARGTFINRNHFAGFIEMVWPLGLGLVLALAHDRSRDRIDHADGVKWLKIFFSSDRFGLQLFLWAALMFILLALLFSKSRAGIAGAFVGFASFVMLVHVGGKRFSWPAWAVMGLAFGFLLFYGNVIGFEAIIGRFLEVDEGAGSRQAIWNNSWAIFADHPYGIGLRNFESVMPVYNTPGQLNIKYSHAHNDYLQLLVEAGWPGFVALVGGFCFFLYGSVRRIQKSGSSADPLKFFVGIGALSGLISIAFHSFFDFNLQIPANMLYFVVLVAIVYSCFWKSGKWLRDRSA